jgi:hypothetical protein
LSEGSLRLRLYEAADTESDPGPPTRGNYASEPLEMKSSLVGIGWVNVLVAHREQKGTPLTASVRIDILEVEKSMWTERVGIHAEIIVPTARATARTFGSSGGRRHGNVQMNIPIEMMRRNVRQVPRVGCAAWHLLFPRISARGLSFGRSLVS